MRRMQREGGGEEDGGPAQAKAQRQESCSLEELAEMSSCVSGMKSNEKVVEQ